MSAVHMALAYLIDPRTPKNEGTFRPVTVKARQGSIAWPNAPAPVTLSTNHCAQEIAEAVIKALAPSCPDRVLAGWSRRFRIAIQGVNPRTKRPFIWHLFHARGGGGASAAGDGWETAGEGQAAGGIKFGSVEVAEARFPLFFRLHEFRPDSAGDGRFRGGVGSLLELGMETTEAARGNTAGDGVRHAAYGVLGGRDGLPHRYRMVARGQTRELKTKEVGIPIPPGAVFYIESAGGGGYGKPASRDRRAREADRENGFVTTADGRPRRDGDGAGRASAPGSRHADARGRAGGPGTKRAARRR
jgi:N-methylhydantoinase B